MNNAAAIKIAASPTQACHRVRDRRRSLTASITRLSNTRSHGSAMRSPGGRIGGRATGGSADLAVVVTVRVALTAVVPLNMSELGETLQVDARAGSEQVSDTVPLNPLVPTALTVKVAVWPAVTVLELGEPEAGEMEKSVAKPERETIWGLSVALSAMTSVPVLLPAAVGVNVTLMVQLPPPATLGRQLLLAAKSLLALIPKIASVPLPVVLSVIDCAALGVPTT